MPTINVQAFYYNQNDNSAAPTVPDRIAMTVRFTAVNFYNEPYLEYNYEYGAVTNLSHAPLPEFPDDATAFAHYKDIGGQAIMDLINGSGFTNPYYTDWDVTFYSTPVKNLVSTLVPKTVTVNGHALSGNVSVTTSDLGLATVAVSGAYSDLSGKPTIPTVNAPSFANPTRSLNSAFQVSTTQNSIVSYSVDIATALSLTGGATGTVYLRYADDSAHTTNVKEVCRFVNGNGGALTIGLSLTQTNTGTLSGVVPSGKYVKMVTENTVGTPTFTFRSAQEVTV